MENKETKKKSKWLTLLDITLFVGVFVGVYVMGVMTSLTIDTGINNYDNSQNIGMTYEEVQDYVAQEFDDYSDDVIEYVDYRLDNYYTTDELDEGYEDVHIAFQDLQDQIDANWTIFDDYEDHVAAILSNIYNVDELEEWAYYIEDLVDEGLTPDPEYDITIATIAFIDMFIWEYDAIENPTAEDTLAYEMLLLMRESLINELE